MGKSIDWSDPRAKISKWFTVHEALWLPSWRLYHDPTVEEQGVVLEMAKRLDAVRDFIGAPIIVHCWIRPGYSRTPRMPQYHGRNYNAWVGGAPMSAHMKGGAVDWHAMGFEGADGCEEIRRRILPKLLDFRLRMEDHRGGWIHNDTKPANLGRWYFKP